MEGKINANSCMALAMIFPEAEKGGRRGLPFASPQGATEMTIKIEAEAKFAELGPRGRAIMIFIKRFYDNTFGRFFNSTLGAWITVLGGWFIVIPYALHYFFHVFLLYLGVDIDYGKP